MATAAQVAEVVLGPKVVVAAVAAVPVALRRRSVAAAELIADI